MKRNDNLSNDTSYELLCKTLLSDEELNEDVLLNFSKQLDVNSRNEEMKIVNFVREHWLATSMEHDSHLRIDSTSCRHMPIWILTRDLTGKDGARFGHLWFKYNGLFTVLHTLERPEVGLERNKGLRIPEGVYKIYPHKSPKFKEVVKIENYAVPADRHILIHAGNTISDSKGCILVGVDIDDDHSRLLYSRRALDVVLQGIQEWTCPIHLVIVEYK